MDDNDKVTHDVSDGVRRIVKVQIRPGWPAASYDAGVLELKRSDWVVVSTNTGGTGDTGREVGQVTVAPVSVALPSRISLPFVEAMANEADMEHYNANLELEKKAFAFCCEQVARLNLIMKLTRVHSLFDGTKIIFYYYAEQRVDFRELVKELVRELRIRIEMRQIGIRHQAKMVGGMGECGREFCCSSYLKTFDPISIKMAKSQNFPLNPSKISGRCGRLLCCLTYEYEAYSNKNSGRQAHDDQTGTKPDMQDAEDSAILQLLEDREAPESVVVPDKQDAAGGHAGVKQRRKRNTRT
ncbi:MAG: regulatory iron-sulfur-containing complex subunit RicT [Dissulfuribacterales bacterium]